MTFVIEKLKFASFSLFLDALSPRPKMSVGQLNVATYIHKIWKRCLGSRLGTGLQKPKKTSNT